MSTKYDILEWLKNKGTRLPRASTLHDTPQNCSIFRAECGIVWDRGSSEGKSGEDVEATFRKWLAALNSGKLMVFRNEVEEYIEGDLIAIVNWA